jgi:nucleoid DNA-binding protein
LAKEEKLEVTVFHLLIGLGRTGAVSTVTTLWTMKREDLARRLAKEERQSRAAAQDEVDALVHRILKTLRAGKPRRTSRSRQAHRSEGRKENAMSASSTDRILKILRRALDRGLRVEIEGLGSFERKLGSFDRKSSEGYSFEAEARSQVFIAYVAEDLPLARRLTESLKNAGCSPWLDKDRLLPGQNWPRAIERAIEISDAFVACFSHRALVKRGQFQTQLRYALDCARRQPLDSVFLVPVRFERCEVPRSISDRVQYVDLFPDWDRGVKRVMRTLRRAAKQREVPRLCA